MLLASTSVANAGSTTPPLSSLYATQCTEISKGDWAAFKSTLAPDYTGINQGGPPDTRQTEPTSINAMMQRFGLRGCAVRIVGTQVDGDRIRAEVYFTLSGTAPRDFKLVKKGDQLAFVFHSDDVWRTASHGLVQESAKTLGVVVLRNGKPLPQQHKTS
jgi:hypothetical protein